MHLVVFVAVSEAAVNVDPECLVGQSDDYNAVPPAGHVPVSDACLSAMRVKHKPTMPRALAAVTMLASKCETQRARCARIARHVSGIPVYT